MRALEIALAGRRFIIGDGLVRGLEAGVGFRSWAPGVVLERFGLNRAFRAG